MSDDPAKQAPAAAGTDMVDFRTHGYFRVAAVAPEVVLADPAANAANIVAHIEALQQEAVALALFPELSITGYSCEDLFFNEDLYTASAAALTTIAIACKRLTAVVGVPWRLPDGRLLNCAAVLHQGRVLGLVPKIAHPNYAEFYDQRWFSSGLDILDNPETAQVGETAPRINTQQLFEVGGTRVAIEICEDLWSPEPPGVQHCLNGADIVLNLSASNELVAKSDYRRQLVCGASARGICGYLYAGAGPLESTKDIVFGGHLLAAENGQLITESERFSLTASVLITEFDIQHLRHERMQNSTFRNARRVAGYRRVPSGSTSVLRALHRITDPHPFVPADEAQFDARAREILDIQATGLARRLLAAGSNNLVIGLSGGLDSTLAFLVCLQALTRLGRPLTQIQPVTMPGPGTSEHTLASARSLAQATAVALTEIPIDAAVAQHLSDLNHDDETDVVFENAQARERTQILFNYANKIDGIVVGTGDLSELALGWCTYNADHMANYNVNASVPKTMMTYLVRWYARHQADEALATVLDRVLNTPISPELIAPEDGRISQETESIIGPFELHDFFLYHFMRHGSGVAKIFSLAQLAFAERYSTMEIRKWMKVFFERFFSQQFKRTTLPPGPKVGSVSLSPRGDWRMPDEVSAAAYLEAIDDLPGASSEASSKA
jgi:NAD+ synthase (glutamine-hydrolysing)